MDSYRSCKRFSTSIEIEKSVFRSEVCPIEDEAGASVFLSEVRAKFPDATHHCYAFVCDEKNNVFRFSDDGEPAKTAGMPILEAIRGRKLFNTAICVTRWFGGIKLGAGGLCRAYSRAALAAIDGAELVNFERAVELELSFDYDLLPKVERFLKNRGRDCAKDFGARVNVRFFEKSTESQDVRAELMDLCQGRLETRELRQKFVTF